MLESYMGNLSVGMTKDAYFDMCETLGSEPLEEEIPVEVEDLPVEAQQAVTIYGILQDKWDYMNGNYIGKDYSNIRFIFELYEVDKEDYRVMFELISYIDYVRIKNIKAAKATSSEPKAPV